ncbi:ankyrin repeat and SAM domain-containing protein 6 [Trichonephila clavipes]|nr:ankyrin repeat and SAM domain-containing protein 6 [Trichonephila clavipes]
MVDNATCHRTLAVQDCLDNEGIQRLVWPARSPDINPIENVWDALGRQVAGRNYPPTNKNTLIRALTDEWDKLPQQLLDNVVQSMSWIGEMAYSFQQKMLTHLSPRHSEKYSGSDTLGVDDTIVNDVFAGPKSPCAEAEMVELHPSVLLSPDKYLAKELKEHKIEV